MTRRSLEMEREIVHVSRIEHCDSRIVLVTHYRRFYKAKVYLQLILESKA